MKRLCALSVAAIVLCGCKGQSPPGTDPFFGRTTVPPPATGAATGRADPYYRGSPAVGPPVVTLPGPQASAAGPIGPFASSPPPSAAAVGQPPVSVAPPALFTPPAAAGTTWAGTAAPAAGSYAQPAAPVGQPPASFTPSPGAFAPPPGATATPPGATATPPASNIPAVAPSNGNRYDPPGGNFNYRGSSTTAPTNPISQGAGGLPASRPAEQVPAWLADSSPSRIRVVEPENRSASSADTAATAAGGNANRGAASPASTALPAGGSAATAGDAGNMSLAGRQPVMQTLQPRPNAGGTAPGYAAPSYGVPRSAGGAAGSSSRPQPTPARSIDILDLPQAATSNASSGGESPGATNGIRLISNVSQGNEAEGAKNSNETSPPLTPAPLSQREKGILSEAPRAADGPPITTPSREDAPAEATKPEPPAVQDSSRSLPPITR